VTATPLRDLWKVPGYAIYFASRFAFHLLIRMLVVIIGWHVYELTGDPLDLGFVGLAMFLPILVIGVFAGDWADRFNRARLVAIGFLVAVVSIAGLFLLSFQSSPDLLLVYIAALLFGAAVALAKPALWALLPQVVPAEMLASAVNISTIGGQSATIAGPAFAGLLLLAGPASGYAGVGLAALAGAVLSLRLVPYAAVPPQREKSEATARRLLAGLSYIWATPILLGMVLLDLLAVLFGSVVVLLPAFAKDILEVGPAGLGLLRAAPAVGAVFAAFVLARAMPRRKAGTAMLGFTALFGLSAFVFAISRDFTLSLVALGIGGAADTVSVVMRHTVLQLGTPDAVRGRVNAASQIFISASNEVGDFRAGAVAGWLGVVPAAAVGGVCTMLVAVLCAWRFPALRGLADPGSLSPGTGSAMPKPGSAS
jgi:MFS family permease